MSLFLVLTFLFLTTGGILALSYRTTTPRPFPPPDLTSRDKACLLNVAVDETLYNVYDKNITRLVKLVQNHVEYVNGIFTKQVFQVSSIRNARQIVNMTY